VSTRNAWSYVRLAVDGARQVDWCFDKPNPESVPVSHHVKWVLVNRCPAATLPLAADAAALAFRRGECRPAATPGLHPPHASGRCERSAGGDCLQAPGASEDGVAAAIDALAGLARLAPTFRKPGAPASIRSQEEDW